MAHTTNRETSDKQRLMEIEASQFIGYWAKTKGIKQADLTQHPQIDDIIILIKYIRTSSMGCYLGNSLQ